MVADSIMKEEELFFFFLSLVLLENRIQRQFITEEKQVSYKGEIRGESCNPSVWEPRK